MPCDVIALNAGLQAESGRFMPGKIRSKMTAKEPWSQLVRTETFPAGIGQVVNNIIYGRSAPTWTTPPRTAMTGGGGIEGGLCLVPPVMVKFGSKTYSAFLRKQPFETQRFCIENIRSTFEFVNQLDKAFGAFGGFMKLAIADYIREDYFLSTQYKVVAKAVPFIDSTLLQGWPAIQATSVLTQGMLNRWKPQMVRNGAGEEPLGMYNGNPILGLMASEETIWNLRRQNESYRTDIRYAYMGKGDQSPLMQGLGIEESFMGFYHMVINYPRRYQWTGGAYVQVPTWLDTNDTVGLDQEINPDWEDPTIATYEESFIYTPLVMNLMLPETFTSPGGNQHYQAMNYNGDWMWKNILHEDCNPDGTIGYFRSTYMTGREIVKPFLGVSFIHLRSCIPIESVLSSGC